MHQALLRQLSVITEEEQRILSGETVDISYYSATSSKTLEAYTLLGESNRIDVRPHTRFVHFPKHRHDFVEIMYVCEGSVTHLIGGKEVVLQKGELLFLGRNSWHEILPTGKQDIGVNLIIRSSFFHAAFDMMDTQNPISDFVINCLAGEGAADEYLHFKVADVLPVQNLVENLIYSLCQEQSNERSNELTMGLLLLQLVQYSASTQVAGSQIQPRALVLQILQYIDTNYADASLQHFAEQHGIPVYTASRLIKNQLGTSFRNLMMERRFSAALRLLETSPLTVTEVIANVGYENTSYFYRTFAQRHGCTPQEYRRLKNKTE
ncbi:MAG: AraC family transcriptional regulator [Faecalibacterium sp.]